MLNFFENISIHQKIGIFFGVMIFLLLGNYLVLTYSYAIYDRHLIYSRACQQNTVDIEKFALHLRQYMEGGTNVLILQNELFEINQNINIIGLKGVFLDQKQEIFLEEDQKIYADLADIRYRWKQITEIANLILTKNIQNDSIIQFLSPFDQKTILEKKIIFPNPLLFDLKKAFFKHTEKIIQLNDKYVHSIYFELTTDRKNLFQVISFLVIFNIFMLIIGYFSISQMMIKPILKVVSTTKLLARGEFSEPLEKKSNDEIGNLMEKVNELSLSLQQISDFANNVGKGNLQSDFQVRSQQDELGLALLDMRENLKKAQEQDNIRAWTNGGFALFGEILRVNQENLDVLTYLVISELVKYLNANQGGLFILEKNEEDEDILDLKASCAYNKRKFLEKKVKLGQGLLGQAILEKRSIHLTEIPQNYTHITSGLGEATPNTLLIVPLKNEIQIYGAIEIAAFRAFQDYEIKFIEKISEDIATTLANVLNTQKTQYLLSESQEYAEQMRAQEEEMMQNMEEMVSIQEGADRLQIQMKEREKSLIQLIDSTQDYIILTDQDYNIKIVNQAYVRMFARTDRTIAEGMNLLEIMTQTELDFWKIRYDKAMQGQTQIEIVKSSNKSAGTIYYEATISPIFEEGEIVGVAMFSQDITRMKFVEWED